MKQKYVANGPIQHYYSNAFSLLEVLLCLFIISLSIISNSRIIGHSAAALTLQQNDLLLTQLAYRISSSIDAQIDNHTMSRQDIVSLLQNYSLSACDDVTQLIGIPPCLDSQTQRNTNNITIKLTPHGSYAGLYQLNLWQNEKIQKHFVVAIPSEI